MKKHQIVAVVGTLALAANLLLPGLAFGQQNGQVQINCPSSAGPTGNVSLARVPRDLFFTGQNSPLTGTLSTFDQNASNDVSTTPLPGGNASAGDISATAVAHDHLLGVTDVSSQGVNGCGGQDGWDVTATITTTFTGTDPVTHSPVTAQPALTGPSGDYINASTIHLVTSQKVSTDNINANDASGLTPSSLSDGVIYNDYTPTGNLHLVTAGSQAAGKNFQTEATFVSGSNTLDSAAVPVLSHPCQLTVNKGENTDVYTGIGMDIDNGIHALQANGTYNGVIQYTFSQARACSLAP